MSENPENNVVMRCLAVDDEPLALMQLKVMIERTPGLQLAGACADAIEAGEVLRRERVDVLFVDINMPEVNGLDFVASLPEPPLVVFTTAYSEYAVDSYKVNAVDYLLKPFGLLEFQHSVEKVRRQYQLLQHEREASGSDQNTLFLRVEHRVVRVPVGQIRYVQSLREYLKFFLADGTSVMTLMPISHFAEQLPHEGFVRIQRSYIVNVRYVSEFGKGEVRMDDGTVLSVGDSFRDNIRQYLDPRLNPKG
ncbi:MAG: LytTR family DNA-binding domain-containing protein [Bacteroidales bacterium]|nr:LytTR family DNA-binding domain-containing protein [Bacteroidales bacterium]